MAVIAPPFAPWMAFAGAIVLGLLPPGAGGFRVLCPMFGAATLALVLWSLADADPVASGFACVAASLGATLSIACMADPSFGGLAGRRLRLARGLPSMMLAASLWAVGCADAVPATLAVGSCALLATLAAGSARGSAPALASWRLLRLQSMAIAGCLLGSWLLQGGASRMAPAGAAMLLLGLAVLGGAAPFGAALSAARASAVAPFGAAVTALLPLTSFAVLLRVRAVLVHDGFGQVAGDALQASGLLAIAIAAALVWLRHDVERRDEAAHAGVFGIVMFAFGLGGVAGLHAGLLALLAASFALPAQVLARGGGRLGTLSSLAICAPPFGLFGAFVVIVETALGRTAMLLPFALLSCVLMAGCLRARPARPALAVPVRVALAVHLLVGVVIGVAMPAVASGRIVEMAEQLAVVP